MVKLLALASVPYLLCFLSAALRSALPSSAPFCLLVAAWCALPPQAQNTPTKKVSVKDTTGTDRDVRHTLLESEGVDIELSTAETAREGPSVVKCSIAADAHAEAVDALHVFGDSAASRLQNNRPKQEPSQNGKRGRSAYRR